MGHGPRIYNLFPLLAGSIEDWKSHLPRIAAMGFDWVFVNPFHLPGFSGSLYAVKDYYLLNPRLQGTAKVSGDELLGDFVAAAEGQGLGVMMDLVINHTAKDSILVERNPHWFARDGRGEVKSPSAIDPGDPGKVTVWGDLAEIDYAERPEREEIVAEWRRLVSHYADLGFRGFRCDAAYQVPAEIWSELIATARQLRKDAVFAAETLGCRLDQIEALAPAGFDWIFNSAKWWDFRADWLLDQYEQFRSIAPSIAFPESHDTDRLAAELAARGIVDPQEIEAVYRRQYLFTATFSTGVMMPMGFEYGFRKRLHVVETQPSDWEDPLFDLSTFIADVNAMKAEQPILNEEGPQRRLVDGNDSVVSLLRRSDTKDGAVMSLINPSSERGAEFDVSSVIDLRVSDADVVELATRSIGSGGATDRIVRLAPLEMRVISAKAGGGANRKNSNPTRGSGKVDRARLQSRRITIQNVWPELDDGRFAIKREVGDRLEVWADIFRDGHGKIAAILKTRPVDQEGWDETPMELMNPGLDRWRGAVRLERNTRYAYTIEAWTDEFESWRDEIGKKMNAGQDVTLELIEGRDLAAAVGTRAEGEDGDRLKEILRAFDKVEAGEERSGLLLSSELRDLMARWPDRGDAVAYDRPLEVVVDRVQARYAAWYEMFHRSQGTEPGKSATFDDCARRLPEIRRMGFDVIYFVPIHPIGRVHRKGPNNTLNAGPDDPGSPYAIGSAEGGHYAVHPDLGTLDDFRRFIRAAHAHGMEVAIDFAIQCAPDHPWIKEHPEWFQFRPDGTIKYAENPPKKYQDIVNVDFDCGDRDGLWRELRDVVLFWVAQGVTIFRVDNPHTKPVPFWEWMIRDVQDRHPETIFLAEAFTRPPMLKMLAKVGYSQSYTYFTWRNFKQELTEYLTELTQTEVKEYLRPNFFANTPDILPPFLQTGARPAFMIRFVLAATLSSVYGIYNGFELCENDALPGREEYNNSEKYDYKVWDWDRPGNIKDFIARVNEIRRENSALHELDNLRFHLARNDNVLFYSKMTETRDNMVFFAVSLNPFDAQETDLELPLAEMGIPYESNFEVEELISGNKHLWKGAWQRVHLDPQINPAEIFRVTPWKHIDHDEPCM